MWQHNDTSVVYALSHFQCLYAQCGYAKCLTAECGSHGVTVVR
jgi:hypothetical protein